MLDIDTTTNQQNKILMIFILIFVLVMLIGFFYTKGDLTKENTTSGDIENDYRI